LTSKPQTLIQKENARIHSTLEEQPTHFVDNMQWSTVTSLMLMQHSLPALIPLVMQPPRNARDQLLLQHTLEKVHDVMEELTN
jgi:hypothetical protein